jgi:2,3-bisphosphoglycerate-dependent phosphoglycerate mutase
MRLYFIRHAQSSNNALYEATGSSSGRTDDPGITPLGEEQIHLLAHHLSDDSLKEEYGLTHLYTSLMTRAAQTGAILAEHLCIPLHGMVDLHESGGVYLEEDPKIGPVGRAGKTPHELITLFPELILPDGINPDGWWSKPFEEPADRPLRATRVFEHLRARHGESDDRVAIISHLGFFNHLYWAVFGLSRPEKNYSIVYMHNTAISRFDFSFDRTEVHYINRHEHLSPNTLSW